MTKKSGKPTTVKRGTALMKYQRLESDGIWHHGAEQRNVVVRMREATLILLDPQANSVISHWSLPAVRKLLPATIPARYAPNTDDGEYLELSDSAMIEALDTVERAVKKLRPRNPRVRGWFWGIALTAAAIGLISIVPGQIKSQLTAMVPNAKRAEIGDHILDEMIAKGSKVCTGERGLPALAELSERLFGPKNTPLLYVIAQNLATPQHLPGDIILLPRALIEQDSSEALAGATLIEAQRAKEHDPLLGVLEHAGLSASFGLLISGELEKSALTGYGQQLLTASFAPPPSDLESTFSEAKLRLTPYLEWQSQNGADVTDALQQEPFKDSTPPSILSDNDWIALQTVCSNS